MNHQTHILKIKFHWFLCSKSLIETEICFQLELQNWYQVWNRFKQGASTDQRNIYQDTSLRDYGSRIHNSNPYNNSCSMIEPNLSSMTIELNKKITNEIVKLNSKKSNKLSKISNIDCSQMLK